jgi:serine/threonine protein kinase
MWSFGVILFVLLGGYPPFGGDDEGDMNEAVLKGRFYFIAERFDSVSGD